MHADRGHAGLEDAGLFLGDLAERVAELGHVVLADRGDRGDLGLDHVRAVEPTAQAGLDDRDVDLLLGEVLERDGRQDVEVRRHRLELRATIGSTSRTRRAKSAVRDHLAVDLDPLADVDQVRAGVEPDLVAGGLEHRRDHRASAALALGAGDVDGLELLVRVAQLLEQGPHAIEVEVLAVVADDAQPLVVAERSEEANALGEASITPPLGWL